MVLPKYKDLDCADVEEILHKVNFYDIAPPERQKEVRASLMAHLDGKPINKWDEINLDAAIQNWQKETIMANTILDLLTPADLEGCYTKLVNLFEEKQLLESEKITLEAEINTKYAYAVDTGEIEKMGKNEDEREGQRRSLMPSECGRLDEIRLSLSHNTTALQVARAELEYQKLVVAYFSVLKDS